MKRNILTILVCLFVTTVYAQVDYYIPTKGKKMIYATKTTDGQIISVTKLHLKPSTTLNDYVVVNEVYQAPSFIKIKVRSEQVYHLKGSTLYTDPMLFFSSVQDETMKYVYEFKEDMNFPVNPKVGDKLSMCSLKFSIKEGDSDTGIPMTATISNHTVAAKESVTTPAGTFECLRFDYEMTTEVMEQKMKMLGSTWYSKGYGLIKIEVLSAQKKNISNFILEKIEKL